MRLLWALVTSPLKTFTTRTPIHTPADFKGLRIRYAGEQSADILRALSAAPLAVPPGETQDGLAKGIIDGATFPYEGAQGFDIGTVVKYCIEPGISASTFVAVMNPKRFDSLPAELQTLIASTTRPALVALARLWRDRVERS
jgi:TRAP-type C4-dicarboxylate transport system substrate-binding protein